MNAIAITASHLRSAIALTAKIVVSEDRWDAWTVSFLKSMNAANPNAHYGSKTWFENKNYYHWVLHDYFAGTNSAQPQFIVLAFTDSEITAQKYEFAMAYSAETPKGAPIHYFATGSGALPQHAGVAARVDNGNELIKAIVGEAATMLPEKVAEQMARSFASKGYLNISKQQVQDWWAGNYPKLDDTIKQLLGPKTYLYYLKLGRVKERLQTILRYDYKPPAGVDVSKDFDNTLTTLTDVKDYLTKAATPVKLFGTKQAKQLKDAGLGIWFQGGLNFEVYFGQPSLDMYFGFANKDGMVAVDDLPDFARELMQTPPTSFALGLQKIVDGSKGLLTAFSPPSFQQWAIKTYFNVSNTGIRQRFPTKTW